MLLARQSQLFSKTTRQAPAEETSVNAQLLQRAGFIERVSAGVWSYLPLGLRSLNRVVAIIRDAMDRLGASEVLLPALIPKELWERANRWQVEVMYRLRDSSAREFGLGWSHEVVVANAARQLISSYRDLPLAVYQIQNKFRDEPRPRSGLLRGREFLMKDLYSFHADQASLDDFYSQVKRAYATIFSSLELNTIITRAGGGPFAEFSDEFQVPAATGEDTVFRCSNCAFAVNREIYDRLVSSPGTCPDCGGSLTESRAIEVGNIFQLGTAYTEPFGVSFTAKDGSTRTPLMGCYGLGPSRLLGTIAEMHHDERGLRWPVSVAPFRCHLLDLTRGETGGALVEKVVQACLDKGVEILLDDRDVSPGVKLKDADLIGLPVRLVVSEKTGDRIEWQARSGGAASLRTLAAVVKELTTT